MICGECEIDYDESVTLNPLFIASKGYSAPVCGICALALMNKEMQVNRKRFNGLMAEQARLDALEFRKKNNIIK